MKKKAISLLLALVMCLSLLPATASAAEQNLPDWYFLFAVFKNVDADVKDGNGTIQHVTYSMTQDEISSIYDRAREFEMYMNQVGVIRAHIEVVEIDEPVTELYEYSGGSYVGQEQAAPLLEKKVDLDRYDHVTNIVNLNVRTGYGGVTSSEFENGTGHSCINCASVPSWTRGTNPWSPGYPVHEFLHFMERLNRKWGKEFGLHDIMNNFYEQINGEYEACYTDIMLNRAQGTAGTGVCPTAWQYPPHVLRTMTELTVPSGVTGIGEYAFRNYTNLTSVTIPSNVTSIGGWAFANCSALTRVFLSSSVTSIG